MLRNLTVLCKMAKLVPLVAFAGCFNALCSSSEILSTLKRRVANNDLRFTTNRGEPLFPLRQLRFRCMVNGYSIWSCVGNPAPELYLVRGRVGAPLRTLRPLKTRVSIKTAEDALLYVRLLSTPAWYGFIADSETEVLALNEVSPEIYYGQTNLWKLFASNRDIITKTMQSENANADSILESQGMKIWMKHSGFIFQHDATFPKAMVVQTKQGFLVRRLVARYEEARLSKGKRGSAQTRLYWVEENIGRDGYYARKKSVWIPQGNKAQFDLQRTVSKIGSHN